MKKTFLILLTACACSLFVFPITFTFFQIGNTKIYLAICGLVLYLLKGARSQRLEPSQAMVSVSLAALAVSIVCVISLAYNETSDTTYALYIVQMLTWIGAAYFVTECIHYIHGNVTVERIGLYLTIVCAVQCMLALVNQYVPSFRVLVDSYVEQGQADLQDIGRMYGIGASLDVAGSRFSCAQILVTYILVKGVYQDRNFLYLLLLTFSFLFIAIVGAMVARTTIVGTIIAFVYFFYSQRKGVNNASFKIFCAFAVLLAASLPFLVYKYNTSYDFRDLVRFGFEPFFALIEKGSPLDTGSSQDLLKMWTILPKNLKTWIIGDGYMLNPMMVNPYYIDTENIQKWGFYMGVDAGYLRFIYYMGMVGLCTFMYFFICSMRKCQSKYSLDKAVFLLLLFFNFVLWIKTSTDIFGVFAMFLVADYSIDEDIDTREHRGEIDCI